MKKRQKRKKKCREDQMYSNWFRNGLEERKIGRKEDRKDWIESWRRVKKKKKKMKPIQRRESVGGGREAVESGEEALMRRLWKLMLMIPMRMEVEKEMMM